MDWLLNISFPLLPRTTPIWLNSIAIWVIVLDALCDFTKFAGNNFKLKGYGKEDVFITIALDISQTMLFIELLINIFKIEFGGTLRVYSFYLIFIVVLASVINGIFLCKSKFNYTGIIEDEERYKVVMKEFRAKRKIGTLCLAMYCISLRIYLIFLPSTNIFCCVVLLMLNIATKTQYNYVIKTIRKYTNNSKEVFQ